jgi:hypothetical protein
VIGGRVLDASALVAFASGTSVYAATAVAAAWAELAEKHHPVLDVLLQLPVMVIDNLNESRARAVGQLGGPQVDAHAIVSPRNAAGCCSPAIQPDTPYTNTSASILKP